MACPHGLASSAWCPDCGYVVPEAPIASTNDFLHVELLDVRGKVCTERVKATAIRQPDNSERLEFEVNFKPKSSFVAAMARLYRGDELLLSSPLRGAAKDRTLRVGDNVRFHFSARVE